MGNERFRSVGGRCQLCGQQVPPEHFYFDAPTGTLIYNGMPARLSMSESVLVNSLLKAFPRVIQFEELLNKFNGGRSDGGMTNMVLYVMLSNLRRKLQTVGLNITKGGQGYALSVYETVRYKKAREDHLAMTSHPVLMIEDKR